MPFNDTATGAREYNTSFWVQLTSSVTNQTLLSVEIEDAGENYLAGDLIYLYGGDGITQAVLEVIETDAGVITAIAISIPGNYSVIPSNPITQESTNGGGSGAAFVGTWGPLPMYAWSEQHPQDSTLVPYDGGRFGTVTNKPVIDPNNAQYPVPSFALIQRAYFDQTLDWVFYIIEGDASEAGCSGQNGQFVNAIYNTVETWECGELIGSWPQCCGDCCDEVLTCVEVEICESTDPNFTVGTTFQMIDYAIQSPLVDSDCAGDTTCQPPDITLLVGVIPTNSVPAILVMPPGMCALQLIEGGGQTGTAPCCPNEPDWPVLMSLSVTANTFTTLQCPAFAVGAYIPILYQIYDPAPPNKYWQAWYTHPLGDDNACSWITEPNTGAFCLCSTSITDLIVGQPPFGFGTAQPAVVLRCNAATPTSATLALSFVTASGESVTILTTDASTLVCNPPSATFTFTGTYGTGMPGSGSITFVLSGDPGAVLLSQFIGGQSTGYPFQSNMAITGYCCSPFVAQVTMPTLGGQITLLLTSCTPTPPEVCGGLSASVPAQVSFTPVVGNGTCNCPQLNREWVLNYDAQDSGSSQCEWDDPYQGVTIVCGGYGYAYQNPWHLIYTGGVWTLYFGPVSVPLAVWTLTSSSAAFPKTLSLGAHDADCTWPATITVNAV